MPRHSTKRSCPEVMRTDRDPTHTSRAGVLRRSSRKYLQNGRGLARDLQRIPCERFCWGCSLQILSRTLVEGILKNEILPRDPAKILHRYLALVLHIEIYSTDLAQDLPKFHVETSCRGRSSHILKRELVSLWRVLSEILRTDLAKRSYQEALPTDPAKILPQRSCPGIYRSCCSCNLLPFYMVLRLLCV